MSSSQNVNICHKTRIENCKGTLLEPRENYKKWAYWCGQKHKGWRSTPCSCPKLKKES